MLVLRVLNRAGAFCGSHAKHLGLLLQGPLGGMRWVLDDRVSSHLNFRKFGNFAQLKLQ